MCAPIKCLTWFNSGTYLLKPLILSEHSSEQLRNFFNNETKNWREFVKNSWIGSNTIKKDVCKIALYDPSSSILAMKHCISVQADKLRWIASKRRTSLHRKPRKEGVFFFVFWLIIYALGFCWDLYGNEFYVCRGPLDGVSWWFGARREWMARTRLWIFYIGSLSLEIWDNDDVMQLRRM